MQRLYQAKHGTAELALDHDEDAPDDYNRLLHIDRPGLAGVSCRIRHQDLADVLAASQRQIEDAKEPSA